MRYRLTFIAGAAVGYVLGARAGHERYEQLRKTAQRIAQNPAVRNTVESAGQQSRELAGKAVGAFSTRISGRLPAPVAERLRSLREQRASDEDDWGTSNT
ncbi:YtxH domain-containing protein [Streptantibioticus rubrisoli]|uniref:YtxH domain-containing protein n=1 Tax=Streptantibioticus rubrisoli TaxID=1387313 RepID=A0ABT1PFN0_9ACTN|nr:YtxH domain-containing protein [Streptantibioticus rubrisoli]MCQ4043606.1 YtxH domain-containing protein [Streptantibioticus rubrisoli]